MSRLSMRESSEPPGDLMVLMSRSSFGGEKWWFYDCFVEHLACCFFELLYCKTCFRSVTRRKQRGQTSGLWTYVLVSGRGVPGFGHVSLLGSRSCVQACSFLVRCSILQAFCFYGSQFEQQRTSDFKALFTFLML